MTRKPYDELPWWCQLLYPWFGPSWYAEIEDLHAWLAEFRRHLAGRVDEMADELATAGARPVVVDRDHWSWAEVDAEQRERTGDPRREEGRP